MTARTQEQDGEMCAALLKERTIYMSYIQTNVCLCVRPRTKEVSHFLFSFSVFFVLTHLSCLGPLHVTVSQGICDNSLPYNKM